MTDHYFSADPARPRRPRTLRVRLAGRDLEVLTAGGVFSTDRLDLGTSVLLREAPDPPAGGNLLDLGCGWGPLALALGLLARNAQVWAVDVNPLALELTAANAARCGLNNVRAVAPEEVPEPVRFSTLWSNPPIRIGKESLQALLLQWLPRLADGGQAFLVVQRNLGADSLHRWLGEHLPAKDGWQVERAGSAKGYRVLRITH